MSTGQWLATVGGAGGATPFWQILGRKSLTGTSDTITARYDTINDPTTETLDSTNGTTNWTRSNTSAFTFSSNKLIVTALTSSFFNESAYFPFTFPDDNWSLRFKIKFTGSASGNEVAFWVGATDTVPGGAATSRDGLGCYFYFDRNNSWKKIIGSQRDDSSSLGGTATVPANILDAIAYNTDYYVEMERAGTDFYFTIYSDSDYSVEIGSMKGTGAVSTIKDLTHFAFIHYAQGAGLGAEVSELQLWNTSLRPTMKPYMMVLINEIATGQTDLRETFNKDGGSSGSTQYTWRISSNDAADSTAINTYGMNIEEVYHTQSFMVQNLCNTNGTREKLLSSSSTVDGSAGAGTSPSRVELAGKWTDTSAIKSVDLKNIDSGDMAAGTEIVILGFDPTDTSGDTAWEELASVDLSGGAATTLSSGTFTPKKYLMIQAFCDAASGATDRKLIVGTGGSIDTGGNYSRRRADNGTDAASASSSRIMSLSDGAAAGEFFVEGFLTNVSSREKMFIGQGVTQGTAGAGNAPDRTEAVGKWANTSGQINIINIVADANMGTNTRLTVWGFD